MAEIDTPGRILGRLNVLSLEFIGVVFVIGVSWATLSNKVAGLETQVNDAKLVQSVESTKSKQVTDDLAHEVNQINRKVDVLGNNQEHFKRQIDSVDSRLIRIQELLENRRADDGH